MRQSPGTAVLIDVVCKSSGDQEENIATMHHCREVLLGLTGMMQWKGCDASAQLARGFVRTIDKVTQETGTFPGNSWSRVTGAWKKEEVELLESELAKVRWEMHRWRVMKRKMIEEVLIPDLADVVMQYLHK